MDLPPQKINLISCGPMVHISDIKLIRIDTTLDLSQKAEKGMSFSYTGSCFYIMSYAHPPFMHSMWDKLTEITSFNRSINVQYTRRVRN